jgi:hypothetical protein
MNNAGINGRVNLMEQNMFNRFKMYDKINVNDKSSYKEALIGEVEKSLLSNLFFSKENIAIIQNAIRKGVYDKSKGVYLIDEQDEDSVKIIMREIYFKHSKHQENVTKEIEELNKYVCQYAVPKLMGEISSYLKYKSDVSTLVVPMDLPKSTYNSQDLEQKPFF